MSEKHLYRFFRLINTGLLVSICVLALYLALMPFLPNVWFSFQTWRGVTADETSLTASLPQAGGRDIRVSAGAGSDEEDFVFGLRIPSIRMRSEVFSSDTSRDLWRGIWHKQSTGNPVDGGNMVITAHRFLYTGNQNTFYHLPRMESDQIIEVGWEGEVYLYRVTETFEVAPTAIEIEQPTPDHVLTLYTCTPLWSNARRFVVRAEPLF